MIMDNVDIVRHIVPAIALLILLVSTKVLHRGGLRVDGAVCFVSFVSLALSAAVVAILVLKESETVHNDLVSTVMYTAFLLLHAPCSAAAGPLPVISTSIGVIIALFSRTWRTLYSEHSSWVTTQNTIIVAIVLNFLGCAAMRLADGSRLAARAFFTWVSPVFVTGNSPRDDDDDGGIDIRDCLPLPSSITVSPDNTWSVRTSLGWKYVFLGFVKFACDMLGFVTPMLLGSFMDNLKDGDTEASWRLVVQLLSATFASSLLRTTYDFEVRKMSLQAQSVLVTETFAKALRTPTHDLATNNYSLGDVMNFIGVDAQRVSDAVPSFHEFWSLPVQVAVTMYLLQRMVGWAFLTGLAIVVLLVPLNMKIARALQIRTREMMTAKDERVNLISEFLANIRSVKLNAWEERVKDVSMRARDAEFKALSTRKYLDSWCVFLWATTPIMVTLSTFLTYVALLGGTLTAERAFTSLVLFNMLIYPINAFPWVINGLMEAQVSYKRVTGFMTAKAGNRTQILHDSNDITINSIGASPVANSDIVNLTGASFAFDGLKKTTDDAAPTLRSVDLHIGRRQLVCITGTHGSGKSALMKALNGNMLLLSGHAAIRGRVSYVGQEPFLLSASIAENIVFRASWNDDMIQRCVEATALQPDVNRMRDGLGTIVGGGGLTLSGGQRMRIALARAMYQQHCSLFLFDDVLSCLDDDVAQHVFDSVILSLVEKGRTVVLVTHDRRFLSHATHIYAVKDCELHTVDVTKCTHGSLNDHVFVRRADEMVVEEGVIVSELPKESPENNREVRAQGTISSASRSYYLHKCGTTLSSIVVVSVFVMQASRNACDLWLTYWVADSFDKSTTYYLTVLAALTGITLVLTLFRSFIFAYVGLVGARNVHNSLLESALAAPLSFFALNPPGRIANRFSRDQFAVDEDLPFQLNIVLAQLFLLLGSVVIMSMGSVVIAAAFTPVFVLYYFVQRYYRNTSRELKRLESTTRSPLYDGIRDVIAGTEVFTGLGFEATAAVMRDLSDRLYDNLSASYTMLAASEWFGLRLQMLGFTMLAIVAVTGVLEFSSASSRAVGTFGLALAYATPITSYLAGLVNSFAEFEKQFISVERIHEYADIPREEALPHVMATTTEPTSPDFSWWPARGIIKLHDVTLRYDAGAAPVVRDVTLTIPQGCKVGVVGRTGSGKSSLVSSLVRLVPHIEGLVTIDDVDVRAVPLATLRSRITVLPQEPALFSGPLKKSVDPFGLFGDDNVQDALRKVGLPLIDYPLTAGGRNLSVGQRQLISLAAAMLRDCKVVVLDEATASLDPATERRIFDVLLKFFVSSTVVCISHNLDNLISFDRIVVMSEGAVVQDGSPAEIISKNL